MKKPRYIITNLAIDESTGDRKGLASSLNNLGNVYTILHRDDEGLEMLRRAADICESLGDQAGYATTLGNIGSVYHNRGEYDTALVLLRKCLALHEAIDPWGIAVGLIDVSETYRRLKHFSDARESLVRAQALATEAQLKELVAIAHCELGLLSEAEAEQMAVDSREAITAKIALMNEARAQVEKGVAILYEMDNIQKDKYTRELERIIKSLNSEN